MSAVPWSIRRPSDIGDGAGSRMVEKGSAGRMTESEGLVRVIPSERRHGLEGAGQPPRSSSRYPPRFMRTASWTRRIVWPRIDEVFQA